MGLDRVCFASLFAFSSMLKPQPPAKPSIELLAQAPTMDNNRLEKLVKNFVVEDKARLAAARNKAMPSSIQYALDKFEKNTTRKLPPEKERTTVNGGVSSATLSTSSVQVIVNNSLFVPYQTTRFSIFV